MFSSQEDIASFITIVETANNIETSIMKQIVFRKRSTIKKSVSKSQGFDDVKDEAENLGDYGAMTEIQKMQSPEEKALQARGDEIKRKAEALEIEKGRKLETNQIIQNELEKKNNIEDAWKYLFQTLMEDCISLNDKDVMALLDATVKVFKLIKEFRQAASTHVKEIVDELSLPVELRGHEQYCTRYYGGSLASKPSSGSHEVPSLLVYNSPRYTVKIGLSRTIDASVLLGPKGLDVEVVEDDIVSSPSSAQRFKP